MFTAPAVALLLAFTTPTTLRDPTIRPRLAQQRSIMFPDSEVHDAGRPSDPDASRLLLQLLGAAGGAVAGVFGGWAIGNPGCGQADYRPQCNWGYGALGALIGTGLGAGLGISLAGLPFDGWIGTSGALIGGALGSGLVLLGALAWTRIWLFGIPIFALTMPMPLILPLIGYQLARSKALTAAAPRVSVAVTPERRTVALAWAW